MASAIMPEPMMSQPGPDDVVGTIKYGYYPQTWLEDPEDMETIIERSRVYVCVYMRTRKQWVDISRLSSGKFQEVCCDMGENIKAIFQSGNGVAAAPVEEVVAEPAPTRMLDELYADCSPEKKEALRAKYPDDPYFAKMCGACGGFVEGEKKKCIHDKCGGMCSSCHEKVVDAEKDVECPCCKEKQSYECPICTEEKAAKDCLKGVNCCHAVCHACFTDSVVCGKQIKKCPMCRKKFLKKSSRRQGGGGAAAGAGGGFQFDYY